MGNYIGKRALLTGFKQANKANNRIYNTSAKSMYLLNVSSRYERSKYNPSVWEL